VHLRAEHIEKFIQLIGRQHGLSDPAVDRNATLDASLAINRNRAAA